ncbi:restriction endonuclease subunit S [Escherichia albertii]|nr:restriction endonuclease subunit S [Escherichia albertii]MCQ8911122.1 restriction endonuclease subunit S [Escherichia albertii]MCQ8921100.1 restriction endonuclease subunit S [Escherichia albertii]MCQ8939440.1 restriction endonuclease subunit S [Escherichia albertii]MCQ8952989.1 restriction endonuclease subunit S [Escherichia albertii]MCQ8977800.1 restriction endonuclease subunit S [Escherichia albertii]
MSWPMVKLEDVINVHYGKALKADQRVSNGSVHVFGSSGIVGNHDKTLCSYPTIIIGRKGSVGAVTWAPNGGWIIDTAYYVEIKDNSKLDLRYLFYILSGIDLTKKTITTSIPGLNRDDLYDTFIKLPPFEEQKRIVDLLDKAEGIRQKREQSIKLADNFLRATFLEMFGDPVENPKKLKKSPITELADVITGFAFKSNEYINDSSEAVRLCRGANTLTGYLDWADTKFWPKNKLEKLDNYLIKAGDIILAMDRPWISSGLKVCIFPENQRETYLVQRVARLRPRCESYTNYIYSCIKSPAFEKHCCPTETTVPHISPVELKNFEVLIPPDELMVNFHSIVSIINNSLNKMASGDIDSDALFSKLSQQAFSGHLKR